MSIAKFLNVGAKLYCGTVVNGAYSNPEEFIGVDNVDGNGLLIDWNITKNAGSITADSAEINIYNLSPDVRNKLDKINRLKGYNADYEAQLFIGWDGDVREVIRGDVLKVIPEMRTATDVQTTITISVGTVKRQLGVSTLESDAVVAWLSVFEALAFRMGYKLSSQFKEVFEETKITLSDERFNQLKMNISYTDQPLYNFNSLISSLGPQYNWVVQNGNMIFLTKKGYYKTNIPYVTLAPESGLLFYSVEDDTGYNISALANPAVVPAQNIRLKEPGKKYTKNNLWVESVNFTGSTNGDSTMQIIAREYDKFA